MKVAANKTGTVPAPSRCYSTRAKTGCLSVCLPVCVYAEHENENTKQPFTDGEVDDD